MIKPCFDGSSALGAPMLWERGEGEGGRLLVGWLAWPLAPDFDFPGPAFWPGQAVTLIAAHYQTFYQTGWPSYRSRCCGTRARAIEFATATA